MKMSDTVKNLLGIGYFLLIIVATTFIGSLVYSIVRDLINERRDEDGTEL